MPQEPRRSQHHQHSADDPRNADILISINGVMKHRNEASVSVFDSGFEPLPISLAHAASVGNLPPHHRDPFDRMLVAQAALEGLTIVTRDPAFAAYEVPLLPA